MLPLNRFFIFFLLLLSTARTDAQQPLDVAVSKTQAIKLGTTEPLKSILSIDLIVENSGMGLSEHHLSQKPNHSKQSRPSNQSSESKNNGINFTPSLLFDGMDSVQTGVGRPDPTGDIGKDYYIQVLNRTNIQVYDKMGNPIGNTFTANTIWNQVGASSSGEPTILFDQDAERWLLLENSSPNELLLAISQSNDPFGGWTAYEITDLSTYTAWGSTMSIWNNEVILTHRRGNSQNTIPVYIIDKLSLLAGAPTLLIQQFELPKYNEQHSSRQNVTPVDLSGVLPSPVGAQPMVVRLHESYWSGNTFDRLEVVEFDVDFNDPNNSMVTQTNVNCVPFDLSPCHGAYWPNCLQEPDGTNINGSSQVIMHQVHYRNFGTHESMVMNFIVDAHDNFMAGIRWIEMRRTPGNNWSVYQEGTIAPQDGLHRFMGAIAMDGQGNIALAYSVTGDGEYPGLRITGRFENDPLGIMTISEYEVADGLSSQFYAGYGKYAAMSVDPFNDSTFWFTGEYRKTGQWGTKIMAFNLQKNEIDIAVNSLVSPQSDPALTATEAITATFTNQGSNNINNFDVGYVVNNGALVVENVSFSLAPNAIYTHTFTQTVDMSVMGIYDIELFAFAVDDPNPINDWSEFSIYHRPLVDVGISNMEGVENGELICGDKVWVYPTITNFGLDTLNFVRIKYEFNGVDVNYSHFHGPLATDESFTFGYELGPLQSSNTIKFYTSDPNYMQDEIPENDATIRTFDAILGMDIITIEILTDDNPGETTWELSDISGNLLLSGGPYSDPQTLYTESFCINAGGCHYFSIFDSAGDGMQNGEIEGNFYLYDWEGDIMTHGYSNFGSELSRFFCLEPICSLSANVETINASDPWTDDGSLIITPTSGVGPYIYSINGGSTYQDSNSFFNLESGGYLVEVRDVNSCIFRKWYHVNYGTVSILDSERGQSYEILPNPTSGRFQIILEGLKFSETNLPIEIFDVTGKLVDQTSITKSEEVYTGEVSLEHAPGGIYFLRVLHPDVRRMIRVVKQ
ncbi:MAG: T9SS type A sorting domain-containing protein [Bacteroidota bacterium]